MILQLQAKVHGLGNLRVLTYTYLSLSDFKATFWIIHSSRELCEARGVVVFCFGSSQLGLLRGSLAGLLAGQLLAWLIGQLLGRLIGWLVCWLVGWLADWLACWLCSFAYLVCFDLLALLVCQLDLLIQLDLLCSCAVHACLPDFLTENHELFELEGNPL